jgi:tricorn protease
MNIRLTALTALSVLSNYLYGQETLLLRSPSVGNDRIAFAYASDIWTVSKTGTDPRRLTVNQDVEFEPVLSPDGNWIAFSGNYDGNVDVYVISVNGGMPRRLTYHPGQDIVRGWHGTKILFASTRASFSGRFTRFFEVETATGIETLIPLPEGHQGNISPDGKFLAYIKNPDPTDKAGVYRPFKLYRGGNMPKIWILNLGNNEIEEIPAANSNNTRPVWIGNDVYFLSDRDNRNTNVYKYDRASKQVVKLSEFSDFPVKTLQSNGKELAFEQAGKIFLMDAAGKHTALKLRLDADIPGKRPHLENASNSIRHVHVSPSGLRAVFEARGEIVTVPAEKGDIRNVTNSPAAHDRDPAWSPDGKYIAYFSDESGEYELRIRDQKAEQAAIKIPLGEPNFYYNPVWSPDSKKIIFNDKHLRLYYVDIDQKKPVKIDDDTYDRPDASFDAGWAPDSKWITYNRKGKNNLRNIYIYELATAKAHQLTDGLSEATNPVFSKDGKYLFFVASTNYSRNIGWLDMSSYDNVAVSNIYGVVLSKNNPSMLIPQSDEETIKPSTQPKADSSKTPVKKPDSVRVTATIDLDGIGQRIEALPLSAKNYFGLNGSADGKLYYLSTEPGSPNATLSAYDIAKQKSDPVVAGLNDYIITADGKKMLYSARGAFGIVSLAGKVNIGDGTLNTSDMKVMVEPEKEWKQMFEELWRIERDFFYVENLHGADWKAIRKKYEMFLPYVGHRDDLNYLFHEMMSELVIGHNYVGSGDYPEVINVNVGLLGADYELADGFYKFKKIYSGMSWNPGIKAPLVQPGIKINEGEYLVAVNDIPLDSKTNLYSLFQNTAGKQTRISTNSKPSLEGAKQQTVIPVASEAGLRLMDWVEANRKKTDELSKGRIAYVYMPNTGGDGYTFFNRYYFSQLDKQAVIIDERFNGGGSAPDYVIDLLGRSVTNYWKNRDGDIMQTPQAVIDGPKAMIVNEYAGSGGDLLPYMFRYNKLGQIIGKRTMGILVGIYNYPVLMDGGTMTAPRLGIFSKDGKWVVENEGVSPDVEIDITPKDVLAGRDPQLEKAVEVLMKQIPEKKPIIVPKDPVRAVQK